MCVVSDPLSTCLYAVKVRSGFPFVFPPPGSRASLWRLCLRVRVLLSFLRVTLVPPWVLRITRIRIARRWIYHFIPLSYSDHSGMCFRDWANKKKKKWNVGVRERLGVSEVNWASVAKQMKKEKKGFSVFKSRNGKMRRDSILNITKETEMYRNTLGLHGPAAFVWSFLRGARKWLPKDDSRTWRWRTPDVIVRKSRRGPRKRCEPLKGWNRGEKCRFITQNTPTVLTACDCYVQCGRAPENLTYYRSLLSRSTFPISWEFFSFFFFFLHFMICRARTKLFCLAQTGAA